MLMRTCMSRGGTNMPEVTVHLMVAVRHVDHIQQLKNMNFQFLYP